MASTIVELSGDEQRLLKSLQRVIDKESSHEKQLAQVGQAGDRTGKQIEGAMGRVDRKTSDTARKGKALFEGFSKSAVASVSGIATGFVGVGSAVQLVNRFLTDHKELLDSAAESQKTLAGFQQEAIKNLAGLTAVDRSDLLQRAVPDIARSAGFADTGEITQAIGAVASKGETDPRRISFIVEQAARVERLKPENLDVTAASATAIQQQTGIKDIRSVLSLLQTTGAQSASDSADVIRALPTALAGAVATVPGQNPEDAARQAAAFFATLTKAADDTTGDKSKTFTLEFASKLGGFFNDLEEERVKARSRIQQLDEKKSPTELDRSTRAKLGEFLSQSEGLKDPGEFFKRIEAIQQRPAIGERFRGDTGFGAAEFQTSLREVLNADSNFSTSLRAAAEGISADVQSFERTASEFLGVTPQLARAAARSRAAAAIQARRGFDIESGSLSDVREIVLDAVAEARDPNILFAARDYLFETGIGTGKLPGTTAVEEAVSGIRLLQDRLDRVSAGGITEQERPRAGVLREGIQALIQFVNNTQGLDLSNASRAASLARQQANVFSGGDPTRALPTTQLSPETAEMFDKIAAGIEKIVAASDKTANNTSPSPPSYGNLQRAGR